MGTLTQKQLERLKLYKYSGVDKSLLSRHVLTPYWNSLVKLFPLNVAPNTITMTGLFFVLINVATLLYFDPHFTGEPLPSWVYFSWAFGLFAYQSMDAIDGKQARRTGMAGPLGEMFDHGCDAINTSLELALCQSALGMSRSWWTVASMAAALANFYLSTWEEYHTGTLFLSAFSGPIEGILLICVIYIITGFTGPAFWSRTLLSFLPHIFKSTDRQMKFMGGKQRGRVAGMGQPTTDVDVVDFIYMGQKVIKYLESYPWLKTLTLSEIFMWFGALGLLGNIINAYINVHDARGKKKLSTIEPLLGLLPFMANTVFMIFWLLAPGVEIVNSSKLLIFLGYWGATFAYQVGQLILAHVTKSPFPYWNWMMIWSALGALDANAPRLFGVPSLIQSSDTNTYMFVVASAVIALVNYLRWAKSTIWQITDFTGLACFTVRHKEANGEWVDNVQEDTKKKQ